MDDLLAKEIESVLKETFKGNAIDNILHNLKKSAEIDDKEKDRLLESILNLELKEKD